MLKIINHRAQSKRMVVGPEEVAYITDFSQDDSDPHHHFSWRVNSALPETITIMSTLAREVTKYALPEREKACRKFYQSQSPTGIITLGPTTSVMRQREYPLDIFLADTNFQTNVEPNDICVGLTTPYFSLFFLNEPIRGEPTDNSEEVVFSMGLSEGKMQGYRGVHDGTLHDNINRAYFTTNYNFSRQIGQIMMATLPPKLKEKIVPQELEEKLNGLLLQYKKPVLLAGAN